MKFFFSYSPVLSKIVDVVVVVVVVAVVCVIDEILVDVSQIRFPFQLLSMQILPEPEVNVIVVLIAVPLRI